MVDGNNTDSQEYEPGMAKPGDIIIDPRKHSEDSDLILMVGVRKGEGYLYPIRPATEDDIKAVKRGRR